MRIEKTNTGIIIHEANYNIKQKCLQYFSLTDPVREYFLYSGNDPNNKPRFGKEHDVIYITSGFEKIKDPIINRMIVGGKHISPITPHHIHLTVTKEPRSDLQRDCIKMLTTSDAKKITIELKPGVNKLPAPAYGDMRVKFSIELLEYSNAYDATT